MSDPHPKFEAVAFDLDGLMFDTEALFFRVAGEMLRDRGKTFSPDIMAAMIGRQSPVAGLAFKTMAGLGESVEELMAEARDRFRALMDEAVHPTPGLYALIAHLKHVGMPRCVATSSRREYAEGLLAKHGLLAEFAFVVTAEDVARSKPDPEIYRLAASRLGVDVGALLVLEDSPAGVSAGKAAGAFVVAIPHEQSPGESLAEADRRVSRLDDPGLMALLK